MTILYHFRTQGAGAEGVHIAGIAGAFEELGHRVVFSSPTGVDPRRTAGESPFRRSRRGLLARIAARAPSCVFELLELGYNAVACWRNALLIEREKPDLIYERHAFFLFSTALLATRKTIPLVVEVNELVGDERIRARPWLEPLARLADRITFRRARAIVVVSPHLKRRIIGMGIPAERILVLPNAVGPEYEAAPPSGSAVRERHGFGEAVVIGFVGWFVPWHRLDRLIESVNTLRERGVRLVLVGTGELEGELREQVRRLGMADIVTFPGAVPHGNVRDYIAATDICVVPHSNEYRSPIKLFEYMAGGRAVVAPRTEPISQVVEDGENGLLFDPEKAAELRGCLERLIADPALARRLGERARVDVVGRHTWAKNARSVLETVAL